MGRGQEENVADDIEMDLSDTEGTVTSERRGSGDSWMTCSSSSEENVVVRNKDERGREDEDKNKHEYPMASYQKQRWQPASW